MKILIISDAWEPQLNGVVRTYQNIIPELEALGHTIKILGPRDCPHRTSPINHDVELALFPKKTIEETLDSFEPDRVHIAVEGPIGWAARKICMSRKIKFTTCFHSNFPNFLTAHLKGIFKKLAPWISKKCYAFLRKFHESSSGIFVASKALEEELVSHGFKGPFLPMTRGAKAEYFHTGSATKFEGLPRPIILSVGRVSQEKNLDVFLSAKCEGTKVVIGEGPYLKKLKKKYPDVVFLGRREKEELGEYFRSADVFAFPSEFDTFGIVQVEALISGIPVAALDSYAAKSVLTTPLFGNYDNDFEIALQKAIASIGDQSTREQRSQKAREQYSWGKAAKQFLAFDPSLV